MHINFTKSLSNLTKSAVVKANIVMPKASVVQLNFLTKPVVEHFVEGLLQTKYSIHLLWQGHELEITDLNPAKDVTSQHLV